jgi:hypothetical protein
MTVVCILASFLNFFPVVSSAIFYRPHWFGGPHHGFGAGGIVIAVLTILLLIFGIRFLMGEGKNQ